MRRRSLSIVIGCTSKAWGGNEKWALDAAEALRERGHEVHVFWTHDAVGDEVRARRIPGRRIRLRGDVDVFGFTSLAAFIRATRADVLLLTKQLEYWLGGLAARVAGRPLVALRLGTELKQRSDLKRRASFGRLADVIIVPAESARRALDHVPGVDPRKVRVVYTGVSIEPLDAGEGERAMRSLGIPVGVPVICGVGRLGRVKGFDLLIEAFGGILTAFPDARLLILGEGHERGALEGAAAGLGESVVFAGHCDRVRQILAGVDVYVLSSRYEGMANTLLEAMSVGAPIVATDVSGTREAVRDGIDALVVPPEDPGALRVAIERLLRDRDLARALGRSALDRARDRFSRERMIDGLEGALTAGREGRAESGEER
jgi:glycosyltransferase involved in cell wall biosynthesis